MDTYKWKRLLIERLISLFKKHENLYNPSHEHYINKNKRATSMLQIFLELRKLDPLITADALRKKLYSLRTQFTKENRMLQIAESTGTVYEPKLWCFEELGFLDRYCRKRNEEELVVKKKLQNPNIFQQLKMEVHDRIRNRKERKYEWLGQLVVSEINKIQNEEIQEAIVWEIQKILHEALTKDRLLRQEDTTRIDIVDESDG